MKTDRLFKDNVYLKEAEAVVTSVSSIGDKTVVTLDRTIFFPEGGGQSCDTGTLGGCTVTEVYEHEDDIFHCIIPEDCMFTAGQTVELKIDWERRFDNMQRHCGEHILSGIFHREFGGINRGFHMGGDYMTIDISLESGCEFSRIDWDMAMHAELEANKVIWQNLPVTVRHFDSKAEAENLPLRKALSLEKDITIVCVGSVENPSDCVACCGTHPSSAGQVGLIKIYKVEANKGMFRIYFEAGQRAMEKYRFQFNVLSQLENSMSAGTGDLLEKYKSQQEKNREARTSLYLLKKEIVCRETEELLQLVSEAREPVSRSYELLSPDDISSIARNLTACIPKILFLIHKPTNTVFLCSGEKSSVDCGKLVKENASIYGGRGGGSKTLARAIFSKEEYISTFIDLIDKHLR